VQAHRIARQGPRRLVRCGELLVLAGLGLMGVALLPSVPPEFAVLAWAVAGGGMGLAYAPLSVTTLDLAVPGAEGKATAGLQLFDVLGQALGTGVAGALVATTAASLGHRSGVGLAFLFGAVVGIGAVVVAARIPARLTGSRSVAAPANQAELMPEPKLGTEILGSQQPVIDQAHL